MLPHFCGPEVVAVGGEGAVNLWPGIPEKDPVGINHRLPRCSRYFAGVSGDDRCRYFPHAGRIINSDEWRRLMHRVLSEGNHLPCLRNPLSG